jgi:Fe-S cluster assembly scaffold protein SufB
MKRNEYAKIEEIPYQKYHDSPTIKFYTSWPLYDEAFVPPNGRAELLIEERVMPGSRKVELFPEGGFRGEGELIELEPSLFSMDEGKILARHILSLEGTIRIDVPRGEKRKIEVVSIPPKLGSSHHHLRIELEDGSETDLVFLSTAKGSSGAPFVTAEIYVKGSTLRMWNISAFEGGGLPMIWNRILSENGGRVEVRNIVIGGRSNLVSNEVFMEGERGKSSISSFFFASNNEKIDHVTNIFNRSPGGVAEISGRGFNFGGTLVHRGKLKVYQEARGSENSLSSIIYRSGRGVKSYSIPSLEVESSDLISASHETSISSIPEDVLFYMRTRGLSRRESLELMLRSFLLWATEGIDDGIVERRLNALLKPAL